MMPSYTSYAPKYGPKPKRFLPTTTYPNNATKKAALYMQSKYYNNPSYVSYDPTATANGTANLPKKKF